MPWVKLDDHFFTGAKAQRAGKDGRALYLAGLCFCAANLTDGVITSDDLRFVSAAAEVRQTTARKLVEVGLWEAHERGFLVHDYLEYNPPADQVKEERRRDAERKRQERRSGGKRKVSDRGPSGRPPGQAAGVHPDVHPVSERSPDVPSRPVPLSTRSSSTNGGWADQSPDDDAAASQERYRGGSVTEDRALHVGETNGLTKSRSSEKQPAEPDVLAEVWALIADAELASRVADKGPVGLPDEWLKRATFWAAERHRDAAAGLVAAHPDWPASRVAAELEPDRFRDDAAASQERLHASARLWGARMAGVLTEDELVDDARRHYAASPGAQLDALDAWRAANDEPVSQGAR